MRNPRPKKAPAKKGGKAAPSAAEAFSQMGQIVSQAKFGELHKLGAEKIHGFVNVLGVRNTAALVEKLGAERMLAMQKKLGLFGMRTLLSGLGAEAVCRNSSLILERANSGMGAGDIAAALKGRQ